jgi:hypothetical protein
MRTSHTPAQAAAIGCVERERWHKDMLLYIELEEVKLKGQELGRLQIHTNQTSEITG